MMLCDPSAHTTWVLRVYINVVWITVHQRNRWIRILRSWINDLFSDFPKETHPMLRYFFIIPLEVQTYVEERSSSISGCFMNA